MKFAHPGDPNFTPPPTRTMARAGPNTPAWWSDTGQSYNPATGLQFIKQPPAGQPAPQFSGGQNNAATMGSSMALPQQQQLPPTLPPQIGQQKFGDSGFGSLGGGNQTNVSLNLQGSATTNPQGANQNRGYTGFDFNPGASGSMRLAEGGFVPAQQVTQFQPTFSPAQQGLGSIQQEPYTPPMESTPQDYYSQYAPTQQYGAPTTSYSTPAANPMTAGLGSYMEGLQYKAPVTTYNPGTGVSTNEYIYDPSTQTYRANPAYVAPVTPVVDTGGDDGGGAGGGDGADDGGGPGAGGSVPDGVSGFDVEDAASGVGDLGGLSGFDAEDAASGFGGGTGGVGDGEAAAGGRIRAYARGGSTPQGLASLGRGRDSMLVHMTPGEVQGLQRLAMAHGGSLTINPQTGLPEAGFLSSMLPMLIGAALAPATGGASLGLTEAWQTAALVGAGTGLLTGSLKNGLMAGLGAYGGAQLGGGLANMGTEQAKGLVTQETNLAADLAGKQAQKTAFDAETARQAAANAEAAGSSSQTFYPSKVTNSAFDEAGNAFGSRTPTTYIEPAYAGPVVQTPPPNFAQSPTELGEIARKQAIDEASQNFRPVATSPAGQALARGPVGNMVEGVSQLGSKEGLKTLGGKLGYAGVAGLAAPLLSSAMEPGKFNPPAKTPTQYYKTSYIPPKYNPETGNYDPASYGPGSYYTNPTQYAAQGGAVGYAAGDLVRPYPHTGDRPNTGGYGGRGEKPQYSRDMYGNDSGAGINDNKAGRGVYSDTGGIYENTPSGVKGLFAKKSAATLARYTKAKNAPMQAEATAELRRRATAVDDYGDDTTSAAQGGLMNTYAAGGKLLRGPGDGMSDSIPAVIKGANPQRAALADGEFVIPADVVSHLGNGSTGAGSKRLYSMMDRIRKARTGNPKQGKQINPDRFMPA